LDLERERGRGRERRRGRRKGLAKGSAEGGREYGERMDLSLVEDDGKAGLQKDRVSSL
jgi:hypothetical protein